MAEAWEEGLRLKEAVRQARYRAGAGELIVEDGRVCWRCKRTGKEVVLEPGEDPLEWARRVDWHVLGLLARY